MDAPKIREAGVSDLHHAVEVHDRCYVQTGLYAPVFNDYVVVSVADFEARWDDQRDRVWMAELDGRLVGYVAVCHRDDGWAQLRYLYVGPAARGHGLGTELVQRVVDFARSWGAPGITLWTMEGLDAAARIYRAFGWRLVETAPAPWHKTLQQQRHDLML